MLLKHGSSSHVYKPTLCGLTYGTQPTPHPHLVSAAESCAHPAYLAGAVRALVSLEAMHSTVQASSSSPCTQALTCVEDLVRLHLAVTRGQQLRLGI